MREALTAPLRQIYEAVDKKEKSDTKKTASKRAKLGKTKKYAGVDCIPVKDPAGRSYKIRLYPNEEAAQALQHTFNVVRWTYNKCVEESKAFYAENKDKPHKPRVKKNKNLIPDEKADAEPVTKKRKRLSEKDPNDITLLDRLRIRWISETLAKDVDNPNFADPKLRDNVLRVPRDLRDFAAQDVMRAYKSNFAKQLKNPTHHFELKFQSKKRCNNHVIVVPARWWDEHQPKKRFTPFLKPSNYIQKAKVKKPEDRVPDALTHDSKITYDRLGRYYLHISRSMPCKKSKAPSDNLRVCALDPGVKTIMTSYDPSGKSVSFGNGVATRVTKLLHGTDKLRSRLNDASLDLKHRTRRNLRRRMLCMFDRVRCLVREMHMQIANNLCSNYDVILLPQFDTQELIKKLRSTKTYVAKDGSTRTYIVKKRRLNRKTARMLGALSHYSFRQALIHKAKFYEDTHVILVNEAYTSRTCGRCGWIDEKMGSKPVFKCKRCLIRILRDQNGARNIALRYLTSSDPDCDRL